MEESDLPSTQRDRTLFRVSSCPYATVQGDKPGFHVQKIIESSSRVWYAIDCLHEFAREQLSD